jgi:hypothetical protein
MVLKIKPLAIKNRDAIRKGVNMSMILLMILIMVNYLFHIQDRIYYNALQ